MLRLRQKLISFSIVSSKIVHNPREYKKDPTLNFYPVVGLKDIKIGTISLNQPNNQNSLTIQMIDELFRFMNSYEHDHTVQNVWIQNRGTMFLGGLCFQQMINNPDYLDKLYKMTAMIAKLNKPIFSYITGGVRNVGAYVLSMSSVALTDNLTSLRIDQVTKGFIPIAGGSHRLSRIPAKIGFYLALTGKKLSANQMSRLGFITGIVKQGVSSKAMRSQMSKSNLFFRDKLHTSYGDTAPQQWDQWQSVHMKKRNLQRQMIINQNDIIKSQQNVFSRFAHHQFKLAQINYQNSHKPLNSFTEIHGRTINNYFIMRHQKAFNYLQNNGLIQKSQYTDIRLPGIPLDKIIRVFGQATLNDAIKLLQVDTSDWGQQTLKALRSIDPLAAHLTFQLLNRAEQLSWDQCLQLEYKIAKKLLSQSQLVLKDTYSGSKYIFVNKYLQKRIQDISSEQITNQFFNSITSEDEQLNIDVPKYSLLPHRDYKQIPDAARLAMNQVFFDDIHLQNQQKQMLRYLQSQKINYQHKSFDIHLLRQKIYNKKQVQNIQSKQGKRIQIILNNSSILKKYIKDKYSFIDNLNDKQFTQYIEKLTKDIFNDGIRRRFDDFNQTAQVIGKQKKLEIFKNLRKTLIKKIVIDGIQTEKINAELNESFKGQLFFNSGSIFEKKNPLVQSDIKLNALAGNLQNKQLSEQYKQNQGAQVVQKNLAFPKYTTKRQQYLARVNESIGKRYQQYPRQWQRSYEYQQMIKKAGQTSQQLAQYLEWGNDAFYTTILNAPAHERTYNELGQKYIQKMNIEREVQKQQLKGETEFLNQASYEFFSKLYSQKGHNHYKPVNKIRDQILPKQTIPKQLQKCFIGTLDLVLKHFQQKYYQQSLHQRKLQLGDFDKYIYENIDREFVDVYKNDVLFVYSYLSILKMKDILQSFKTNGGTQNIQDLSGFFKQYMIEFEPDQDIDSINKIISKFLFYLMDIHSYTKSKIRLPQNKLLDFLNRIKIFRQTNRKSLSPLSFESILLMIAKDRSKLYNKVLQQFLPSQPQYLLQIANLNAKQLVAENQRNITTASTLYSLENVMTTNHLDKKQFISGYQYYLGLFDSFIQRASGKYSFVNDETLSLNPQEIRKSYKEVLNLQQSNQQWLDRTANLLIRRFFNVRLDFEKNLTKGELLAFDQELKQILSCDMFKLLLKYQIKAEIQSTKQIFRQNRHYQYELNHSEKSQQIYCEIRRNVKNPDAFRRLNNLKLAMQVQNDYLKKSEKGMVLQEEKEDLVDEKRQFMKYQRFPKQTYKRIVNQSFTYGQEKNYDQYLNVLGQKEMDIKQHTKKILFSQDERKIKKDQAYSSFSDQIRSLKTIISKNNNNQQIDGLYKRIEELL